MIRALASRADMPFMVTIPNDPDALKLIRLLLIFFNFLWSNRQEVLLLVENINKAVDLIEAILDTCAVCYDMYLGLKCRVKYAFAQPVSSFI
jgi:hypothetical protein